MTRKIAISFLCWFFLLAFQSFRTIAQCNNGCAEVRYMMDYQYGHIGDCRDWQTDSADALLAANTKCVDNIWTPGSVGGTGTQHPTIKRRQRVWSACTELCECTIVGQLCEHEPIIATVGGWGSWVPACYCENSGS